MFKEPRPKKHNRINKSLPLPLFKNSSKDEIIKFNAVFNGICVVVENVQAMEKLYYNGFFGKANLSRGFPCFNKNVDNVPIIRKRQFDKRNAWNKTYNIKSEKPTKVIVVPDSDSESEIDDYFTNLKATYQIDPNNVKENLHLNLEEAMFLHEALKCLNIVYDKKLLSTQELWDLFCETDPYFFQNYAVYYYFRAKNWVVKSGLKFGGDFLLYKDGPPFYHASYLVIVDIIDSETKGRRDDICRRSMNTVNIIGLNRLCETAGKELLICQILLPKDFTPKNPEDINKINVKPILMNRFILPQEREAKDDDVTCNV